MCTFFPDLSESRPVHPWKKLIPPLIGIWINPSVFSDCNLQITILFRKVTWRVYCDDSKKSHYFPLSSVQLRFAVIRRNNHSCNGWLRVFSQTWVYDLHASPNTRTMTEREVGLEKCVMNWNVWRVYLYDFSTTLPENSMPRLLLALAPRRSYFSTVIFFFFFQFRFISQ